MMRERDGVGGRVLWVWDTVGIVLWLLVTGWLLHSGLTADRLDHLILAVGLVILFRQEQVAKTYCGCDSDE